MSTFDENTEHEDRPEFDDNGEPIIYIDEDIIPDEFASENDGVIDLDVPDESFYETVWGGDASSVATLAADDSTTGEQVTDPLEVEVEQDTKDTRENDGILEQANEDYNNAVDILIDILTQALAQGEITEEMNASILDAQGTKTKNEQIIKEICNVQEDNSILKQLADIKANMVAASVDDIIDILTEGGTKPWLYKDSDNNVLVDSQSIPELTVLVNKLNLIATDGGDSASEIQLTPEFIHMVVQGTGSNESVSDISTKYYLSTSTTELIGGNWLDTLPTADEQEGKYLWYKIITTYKDPNIEPKETEPVCISARDGKDGTSINIIDSLPSTSDLPASGNPGDCYTVNGELYIWSEATASWKPVGQIKGEPGANSYLHIKYSDDGKTFTANDGETPGIYIGVLSNNTKEDSTNFNDYTWSRIRGDQGLQGLQGPKGEQGIQGEKGDPGKTTYFHIKYSSNANGNPMTETPSEYIGTYVDYNATDSTDYTKYTWSRFQGLQGAKGEQGIPGKDGSNGQTYYLHIKYSNDGGKTFTSNNGETPGTYIGVYTDTTQADSTSVSKYTWSKVKGEQGQSLTKSTPQWYASTSKTTQTGGSWVESMPTIDASHYLWLRYKLDWANPTATTYTTPTLEQIAENVKEVSAKQSEFKQDLDGFKTTVSKTYATKDEINSITDNIGDYMINISKSTILLTSDLDGNITN